MMWGTVMLVLFLLALSVFAVMFIHPLNAEIEESGAYEGCARCGVAFASVTASCLTFIQQILAGDSWGQVTIPIIEAYPITAVYFLFVFMCISMAIMNMILGVVVDAMLQARKEFEADLAAESMMTKMELQNHLLEICQDMDADGSGVLTFEELISGYENFETFRNTLAELGCDKEELAVVWVSMDSDKSGTVTFPEFCTQLYNMKTSDTSYMLAYIKHNISIIKEEMLQKLAEIHTDMQGEMHKIGDMNAVIQKLAEKQEAELEMLEKQELKEEEKIDNIAAELHDMKGEVDDIYMGKHPSPDALPSQNGSIHNAQDILQQQRADNVIQKVDAAMIPSKPVEVGQVASCGAAVGAIPLSAPENAGGEAELAVELHRWRADLTQSVNAIRDGLDRSWPMPVGSPEIASSLAAVPPHSVRQMPLSVRHIPACLLVCGESANTSYHVSPTNTN